MKLRVHFVAVALVVASACSTDVPDARSDGTWGGTITTEGNVTTVINESGSVWGGTATLVEEASIGVDVGADEYMFGLVVDARITDERIYVLDRRPPVVRVFDLDGIHLFDIGREGGGPGEFRSPQRLQVGANGRLFVMELRRLSIFDADGQFLESWPGPFFATLWDIQWVATVDGQLYLPQEVDRGARAPGRLRHRMHMVPLGPEMPAGPPIVPPDYGVVPLLTASDGRNRSGVHFWPRGAWVLSPDGALVSGSGDAYRFEIQYPDGSATSVERVVDPVPVLAEEAAWHRRHQTALMRRNEQDWKWNGPEIPPIKPYYYAFTVASDGGIWVARQGVGIHVSDCDENPSPDTVSITRGRCWREEVHIDAFDADGRFLGEIAEPNFGSTRFYRVHGRTVVTWGLNPDGIPMVKRYRLVLPGEAEE